MREMRFKYGFAVARKVLTFLRARLRRSTALHPQALTNDRRLFL